MIDVSNVDSYPIELGNYIMSHLSMLPSDIVTKIKNNDIEYGSDVICAIENYLGKSSTFLSYENLVTIMEKYDLVVYHATKILHKSMILENGLKINDWKSYHALLSKTFKTLGMRTIDIENTMTLVKHEYDRKYKGRDAQLCFFSGFNQINGNLGGCEQFCESIGGEIARRALKERHLDKYKLLSENGEAFIVKFKIPFVDIACFDKERVAYEFVSYYAARYFFDFSYQVEFQIMTKKDVPANNILKMIPYPIKTIL